VRGPSVRLTWEGKDKPRALPIRPRLIRSWQYPEGRLIQGDNLDALDELAKEHSEAVSLAYLDPPFLTNRVHEAFDRKSQTARTAFDDRWPDRATFLESLCARIARVRELLAPHGSMVLHVDSKTSHYLKVLCDEIFGEEAFASEIIWRYRRWPSKTPNFQRVHDVLLRYRKDPRVRPRWNRLYEPLAPSTLATWGTGKQRAVFDKSGRRLRSSTTPEETRGVPLGDVWDVGVIAPVSHERTGYPSQKPEALLDRIVTALSDPDDLVLDPYAGSGTTLVVAAKRGRRFIGIDESAVAIETCQKRLSALGLAPEQRRSKSVLRRGEARAYGNLRRLRS
jgi:DNA modification methylase